MAMRILRPLAVSLTLVGTGLLPSAAAWAQSTMPGGALSNVGPLGAINSPGKAGNTGSPAVQPPAALPGARSAGAVAPATKLPTDMSPNDALFDAINRGDVAAARDAINRGAELDAHNILGMTPMELSVDLGRNDISFLLLSLRADQAPAAAPEQGPAAGVRNALAAPQPKAPMKPTPVAVIPKPASPKLFANDGGTPNPAAGFLGFDPTRTR
jgi:hypothetical protein